MVKYYIGESVNNGSLKGDYMIKHKFKTITAVLLLAVVVAVALAGCNAPDPTGNTTPVPTLDPTPTPTVLTKEEAKQLFSKALADTFAAKSMNFSVVSTQSQKVVTGETVLDDRTLSEKTSGMFITDSESNVKAHLNTEYIQNNDNETAEGYYLNGKLYYNGDVVSVDKYFNFISIDTIMKRYLSFTDSYDSLLSGIFDERIADCFTINKRTVSVSINDVVKFVEAFAEDSTSESELEEMKQMLAGFSFTITSTVGDDGYISALDYSLQMDATQDEATSTRIMSLSAAFSQVNKVEDKGLPTWLSEYLSNPENFADRCGYDENGQLAWYEVDTTANGYVTKTVHYNADGSVVFYREYTYDDNMRVLTDIKYSADGTEIEKTVCEFEDAENGEPISCTERYYENGELKTVQVYNYVDNALSSTSYYENGVKVREEYWTGDVAYYHYDPNGELFCYEIEEGWGSRRYYDAEGNELTINEYYKLTYTVEEYDDSGKCIKKTEYNVEKQVQSIITFTYDENGNLASELKTDNSNMKVWEKTYKNGVLYSESLYKNGLLDIENVYYENGNLQEKTTHYQGMYNKIVEVFHENGKLSKLISYDYSGAYTVSHYNDKELCIESESFDAEDKLQKAYRYEYDEKDRIVKQSIYGSDNALKEYSIREYYTETLCIITRYDANGNELGKHDTGNDGSGG